MAVPISAELAIVTVLDTVKSSSDALSVRFDGMAGDAHVYIIHLPIGQIKRKSLSKQIRPVAGFSIGAVKGARSSSASSEDKIL